MGVKDRYGGDDDDYDGELDDLYTPNEDFEETFTPQTVIDETLYAPATDQFSDEEEIKSPEIEKTEKIDATYGNNFWRVEVNEDDLDSILADYE